MVQKFIEWLEKQTRAIYVWGAQGEFEINEAWIRKMETSERNAERAIALFRKRQAVYGDTFAAYDCSGLIVRFLLDNHIISGDMTSAGLYNICDKIERTDLSPGDFVFRHNGTNIHHVGVYIGNHTVIHAKGRDVGVVREHIDINGDSYWNKFGRCTALINRPCTLPCRMRYTGDTFANLRTEPNASSNGTIIDKVTHGEDILVLSFLISGWAEVIKKCASGAYKRGYCISKHLKAV